MLAYQRDFFSLAERCGVLSFGEFTLKSGRQSPYFFNLGKISSGGAMQALAAAYAAAILERGLSFDMLFGPAYKGIPLVTAVALALADRGQDLPYAFNRKETKDHGEGGNIVGAPLTGRVLILDDVLTAGTALREAIALIRAAGATPAAALLAFDRQERGRGTQSTVVELAAEQQLDVHALVGLSDLQAWLAEQGRSEDQSRIKAYREAYGMNQ